MTTAAIAAIVVIGWTAMTITVEGPISGESPEQITFKSWSQKLFFGPWRMATNLREQGRTRDL
jgi:hypothetical protein